MSNTRATSGRTVRLAALATPLFAYLALVALTFTVSIYSYDTIGKPLSDWFNVRSDKFYSAAFTLLAAFWGASLTVWALLKSRATRYIESLHDNVIFARFVGQFERRLVYAFIVLVASFSIYVQDFKLDAAIDARTIIAFVWLSLYAAVMAALFDVIATARAVL